MIKLEVLGEPKAQMRHRSVKMGNFIRNYDPSADIKKDFLLTVQNNAPEKPIEGPIELDVVFYFGRPMSHYKTGKNSGMLKDNAPEYHIKRPDSDNACKFLMDSLNGIFWRDDSQICILKAQKKYSDRPRTEVVIETL